MKLVSLALAAALATTFAAPAFAASAFGFANYHASLKANGATKTSNGLDAVQKTGPGVYRLTFVQDVLECSVAATVAGKPGFATYANDPADDAVIVVRTFDQTGAAANRAFSVVVLCN